MQRIIQVFQEDPFEFRRTGVEAYAAQQEQAKIEQNALSQREECFLASSRPRQCGGGIILLVEEEEVLRRLLSRFLRNTGYQVLEASDAMEAIRLWAEQRGEIELLYTDLTMPEGMNGLDLCRRLRQDKPELKGS